jgi:hypothetical protein
MSETEIQILKANREAYKASILDAAKREGDWALIGEITGEDYGTN